jgi:hypothetical protein
MFFEGAHFYFHPLFSPEQLAFRTKTANEFKSLAYDYITFKQSWPTKRLPKRIQIFL